MHISPAESIWTTVTAFGEGGHNYHHTFPQDYRTSEMKALFNLTKQFIDFFAYIGRQSIWGFPTYQPAYPLRPI